MHVLITGISGVGKSSITQTLSKQGFRAVDADGDEFSHWVEVPDDRDPGHSPVKPGRDWVWREDRIRELLATEKGRVLFLSGCAANMGQFISQFDHIVLLSPPAEVIVKRLATRVGNDYGKRVDELARILAQKETIEPLLRKVATAELDTSGSLAETVELLLQAIALKGSLSSEDHVNGGEPDR